VFVATIERASILFSLRFTNPGGNATNSRYAPKVVPAGVTVHAIGMAPASFALQAQAGAARSVTSHRLPCRLSRKSRRAE
jgi:hypothetical protein